MSWPQISVALKETRHELCMTGKDFNEHLQKHGLDDELFKITSLNYLMIHDTSLEQIPLGLGHLLNLQTLSLHSNKITSVNACLEKLDKLKVLDLSRNAIKEINIDFNKLQNLTTINLSNNKLEQFPVLEKNLKIQVVDLSNNQLKQFPAVVNACLVHLSDLKLNNNLIGEIPEEIGALASLKNFDISANKLQNVPGNLINCSKLKELNLKENPIKDRRFAKLIDQCRTKQVLDYVKQHMKTTSKPAEKGKKKGKNRTTSEASSKSEDAEDRDKLRLIVKYLTDETPVIVAKEDVKIIRPFIIGCLLHDVVFTEESFKKFIQLQNRLHDEVCDKRNIGTLATHDAKHINGKLVYTAVKPTELKIKPLNRMQEMSGSELFQQLQQEAENLRKEKKRNTYSGIHKYLYLLEGKETYPCLVRQFNEKNEVISFPPITNSDVTKITPETTDLFLEVTGHANAPALRKIMDVLVQETMHLMQKNITIEQVKVVDVEGNLKSLYPSKTDLNFEAKSITVVR